MTVSLGELAVRFGCELRGDPDVTVDSVSTLSGASERSVTFLANPKYRRQLAETRAAAVVVDPKNADACPVPALIHPNPYLIYARIATLIYPAQKAVAGVHPTADISPDAKVDPTAEVGPFAVIKPGVSIGARAIVGPHCSIDESCVIAEDVRLVARVTLYKNVQIGARTLVHAGVVIGSDGFGFAPDRGAWVKIPQVGAVRIGADVEIGSNTTIDRGAIEDTVIEDGVKLDNQIQIGHNTRIGEHTAIAGCSGISGSAVIGKRCQIGGQCGIAGHISIADDVVITGKTMVTSSIPQPGVYSGGIPFEEARVWRKIIGRFKRLDTIMARVDALEAKQDKK